MPDATFNALCESIMHDDLALHALADWLEESGDHRASATRRVARLWDAAAKLEVGDDCQPWTDEEMCEELKVACATAEGWADSQILGVLIAYHCPSGCGRRMRQTWPKDSLLPDIQRNLLLIALELIDRQQADAAIRQADAAWRQADAARRQADAAWQQADAAIRQADAARRQADAARQQAYAARRQAYAARQQAYAARRQADAAWQQAWRWMRACWNLILEDK